MSNLEKALDKLNKTYGKGTVMNLGDDTTEKATGISTGSIGLDLALGIGGVARNRMIELIAGESMGKTSLALHIISNLQKEGGNAAFLDMEHALDRDYASALGVDIEKLAFAQPDNGEQCLDIAEELIKTGEVRLVVIDSVAALVPQDELAGEAGDTKMGLQARLMSQACRRLTPLLSKNNTTLIFINQWRKDIGAFMGSGKVPTGGEALKYYTSQRIELIRTGSRKDKDGTVVSNQIKAKVLKNKLGAPFKVANFEITFGVGIDKMSELIDFASELDIIKKSGSWFSYNDEKLGQGQDNVKKLLEDNTELFEEIESKVLEEIG